MSAEDESRAQVSAGRLLRQRLWGAAVLIALAVIVLPLVLDGSGSESRFRELEAMREAPVRNAGDAQDRQVAVGQQPSTEATPDQARAQPSGQAAAGSEPSLAAARPSTAAPSAWIVQAGSFSKEANAVSLRDRLRGEGFASFVNQRAADDGVYRVNVGPMISRERADLARRRVDDLLGRESFVGKYP